MRVTRALHASLLAIGITSLLSHGLRAQQAADVVVRVGDNDLGGTITSTNGPEAGVWVIAETTELPTKLAKIAVTDDRGRYLIPDLPKANYSVWVRGYGLVDSPKAQTVTGKCFALRVAASAHQSPRSNRSTRRRCGERESSSPGTDVVA